MKTIKTLQQLADYINSQEVYHTDTITEIIEYNGWIDMQHTEFDICTDGKEKITINGNGEAEVKQEKTQTI